MSWAVINEQKVVTVSVRSLKGTQNNYDRAGPSYGRFSQTGHEENVNTCWGAWDGTDVIIYRLRSATKF